MELKLAIEVDGGQHFEEIGRRHDEGRDLFLPDQGIRTLRFSNLDVVKETEEVAEAIWSEVQARTRLVATPSSSFSPTGVGEEGGASSEAAPAKL